MKIILYSFYWWQRRQSSLPNHMRVAAQAAEVETLMLDCHARPLESTQQHPPVCCCVTQPHLSMSWQFLLTVNSAGLNVLAVLAHCQLSRVDRAYLAVECLAVLALAVGALLVVYRNGLNNPIECPCSCPCLRLICWQLSSCYQLLHLYKCTWPLLK